MNQQEKTLIYNWLDFNLDLFDNNKPLQKAFRNLMNEIENNKTEKYPEYEDLDRDDRLKDYKTYHYECINCLEMFTNQEDMQKHHDKTNHEIIGVNAYD